MNFLHKKHVQAFPISTSQFLLSQFNPKGNITSQQQSQNSYSGIYANIFFEQQKVNGVKEVLKMPHQNIRHSRLKQPGRYSSYVQNETSKKTENLPNINKNACKYHENQILRHLCIQCNQLLCSQCISDHLEEHKEKTNTIPKIETINKLRREMNIKAQKILEFIQENNPNTLLQDISQLKHDVIVQINQIKDELLKMVESWCQESKNRAFQLIQTEKLNFLRFEMNKIQEEVQNLYNQMVQNGSPSLQAIKKINLLDSQKLQAAYSEKLNQFSEAVLKSKFTFECEWKSLKQSFDSYLLLKPLPFFSKKPQGYRKQNAQINKIPSGNQKQKQQKKKKLEREQIYEVKQISGFVGDPHLNNVKNNELFQSINSLIEPHYLQSQANAASDKLEFEKKSQRQINFQQMGGERLKIFRGSEQKSLQKQIKPSSHKLDG